jgi:hypothetical protein
MRARLQLNAALKALHSQNTENTATLKVLEDALELKAEEFGLDSGNINSANGGAKLLAEVAKLRGELKSLDKANKEKEKQHEEATHQLQQGGKDRQQLELDLNEKKEVRLRRKRNGVTRRNGLTS